MNQTLQSLIHFPPSEFISSIIPVLDQLTKAGLGPNVCFAGPKHIYLYMMRKALAKHAMLSFSDYDKNLLSIIEDDFDTHGVLLAIGNWLDWKEEKIFDTRYDYHHYSLNKTRGLVLRYPIPVLAAASFVTNDNFAAIYSTISSEVVKEIEANVVKDVLRECKQYAESEEVILTGIKQGKAELETMIYEWAF